MPLPQSDSAAAITTAYDSVWASSDVPEAALSPLETIMLSHDRLYVVLAVVLIIWFGIVILLLRSDRRLTKLERRVDAGISDTEKGRSEDNTSD